MTVVRFIVDYLDFKKGIDYKVTEAEAKNLVNIKKAKYVTQTGAKNKRSKS